MSGDFKNNLPLKKIGTTDIGVAIRKDIQKIN
jgi:hypothetical protein